MIHVLVWDVASLSEESRPELDPDDAEDEEHEEAEQEDVAQHGEGVQQEHHQDAHAWETVNIHRTFEPKIHTKNAKNYSKNTTTEFGTFAIKHICFHTHLVSGLWLSVVSGL